MPARLRRIALGERLHARGLAGTAAKIGAQRGNSANKTGQQKYGAKLSIRMAILRDPKTGHFLPGNEGANLNNRNNAKVRAQITAHMLRCVTPEDAEKVYQALMSCIEQSTDKKTQLAAVEFWHEWYGVKPEQSINVQTENKTIAAKVNFDALSLEERKAAEDLILKMSSPQPIEATAIPAQLPPSE